MYILSDFLNIVEQSGKGNIIYKKKGYGTNTRKTAIHSLFNFIQFDCVQSSCSTKCSKRTKTDV